MKIFLLLIVLSLSALTISAQNNNTPYDFPIKPGTEQWKFGSPEEMYSKCQIPKEIISDLTTEALAKTCLNYPLFGLMNAFNTPQTGFYAVKNHFNGIDALFERKDAGKALISIYRTMNPANIDKSWSLLEKGCLARHFAL
ncbi:MAG: hypothetical protein JST63_09025 [Bacteroidetes bacterium]|nr:hypothetical protein [Bacteroidota bacterium]